MPRKNKFKDNEIAVCIESFVSSALPGGSFPVAYGARLRGSHPIVRLMPQFFAHDGTPDDEVARLRARIYADAEAAVPPPPPPAPVERRLRDEDALINIHTGSRVDKKSHEAKAEPGNYVPVTPPGLDRNDALLATATMREIGEGGHTTRIAHAGTWIAKSDPFVELHPESFALPSRAGA